MTVISVIFFVVVLHHASTLSSRSLLHLRGLVFIPTPSNRGLVTELNEGRSKVMFLSLRSSLQQHLCNCWTVVLQRLKAALSQQSPSGHSMGVLSTGSSPMVPQRAEQNQLLVQQPDAPSPAQPQVLSFNSWLWVIYFSKAGKGTHGYFDYVKRGSKSRKQLEYVLPQRLKLWLSLFFFFSFF